MQYSQFQGLYKDYVIHKPQLARLVCIATTHLVIPSWILTVPPKFPSKVSQHSRRHTYMVVETEASLGLRISSALRLPTLPGAYLLRNSRRKFQEEVPERLRTYPSWSSKHWCIVFLIPHLQDNSLAGFQNRWFCLRNHYPLLVFLRQRTPVQASISRSRSLSELQLVCG